MTLALVKRALRRLPLTLAVAWGVLWADLYDARAEFAATITERNRLGCGGLRLMFGLGNPWSDLVYHQCVAGAQLVDNMMGLALTMFVEVPMAKCVCKDTSGQSILSFVRDTCALAVPPTLLPTLYMISAQERGLYNLDGLACRSVLASAKARIQGP